MAMIESVAEKGYAQTSVADVLSRSGVSRATFYALFQDKEACFRATYQQAAAQIAAVMGSGIQAMFAGTSDHGPLDPLAQVDWVLGLYLEMLASQPAFAKAFLVEVYAAGPEAIRQRQASLEGFIDVIAFVLRDTELKGNVEKRVVIRTLVHAISSMVTQMVGVGEAERLPELRKPVMELAASLILGK
jgi:AcrR family transcriptional regulator